MTTVLDEAIREWIERRAFNRAVPVEQIVQTFAEAEIANRINSYPRLGQALNRHPLYMAEVALAGRQCKGLGGPIEVVRFEAFMARPGSATALVRLLEQFPCDDQDVVHRINVFVEKCRSLGYSHPTTGSLFGPSVMQFVSMILTTSFPTRFVDCQTEHWRQFASELNTELPTTKSPAYGEFLVAVGRLGMEIASTPTFQKWWPNREPLWTIAGICREAYKT